MQHTNGKAPLLISIDEELHDVRRVLKNGEEDDLRGALNMMIKRVEEMRSLIVERERIANSEKEEVLAAKQKEISALQNQLSEKDVELGVTRSNLRMVTANNEMLEEALRGGGGGSLGWGHRHSESSENSSGNHSHPAPMPKEPPLKEDSRFFNKFRFNSRPGTPSSSMSSPNPGLTKSPSLPHASSTPNLNLSSDDETSDKAAREQELLAAQEANERRVKQLKEALEKEQTARTDLEAELESLSQALFEEANKMVATERRKLAETVEELRETQEEREALRSALRVVEGENVRMRAGSTDNLSHSRNSSTSSMLATKSRPSSRNSRTSTILMPRPQSASPSASSSTSSLDRDEVAKSIQPELTTSTSSLERDQVEEYLHSSGSESGYASATEDNTEPEPTRSTSPTPPSSTWAATPPMHHRTPSAPWEDELEDEPSPWADTPGSPPPGRTTHAG